MGNKRSCIPLAKAPLGLPMTATIMTINPFGFRALLSRASRGSLASFLTSASEHHKVLAANASTRCLVMAVSASRLTSRMAEFLTKIRGAWTLRKSRERRLDRSADRPCFSRGPVFSP